MGRHETFSNATPIAADMLASTILGSRNSVDPILEVIEETKRLVAVQASLYERCGHLPESDPAWKPHNKAHDAMWRHIRGTLIKTVPTTVEGCKELAQYALELSTDQGAPLDGQSESNDAVLALIARSPAASLPGETEQLQANGIRLDLSSEFIDLSCRTNDVARLASIACIVRDDVLRQEASWIKNDGYTTLMLLETQVRDLVWSIDELCRVARNTDESCEKLGEMLAEQDIRVRERRAARA